MSGGLLLITFALLLRTFGAMFRVYGNLGVRISGWILCPIAVWLAAGAAGAYAPLWPVLVLGSGGVALDLWSGWRRPVWVGTEALVVIVSGFYSVPPLGGATLTLITIAIAGSGYAVDSALMRVSQIFRITRIQAPTLALTGAIFVTVGMLNYSGLRDKVNLLQQRVLLSDSWPYIGVIPNGVIPSTKEATRIVLETGAIAWLEQPPGSGPFPGALLFHGAHPDGSQQSSAIVLRRALVDAGFIVLSVDHPGYGESPFPRSKTDVADWDPLPTVHTAFETLRSTPAVDRVFVVGHSMGTTDALRLLNTDAELRSVVIFGASLEEVRDESPETSEYWYWRFHADRRMQNYLPREQVLEIRSQFYEGAKYLPELEASHAPVLFARFDMEWPNIVDSRDALYNAFPGQKAAWHLHNSTHYFNSYEKFGIIIGDTRVARTLATRFRLLNLSGFSDSSNSP